MHETNFMLFVFSKSCFMKKYYIIWQDLKKGLNFEADHNSTN
jgi:hypothetical protein